MSQAAPRSLITIASYASLIGGALIIGADLQHIAPDFMDPNTKFSETVRTPLWLLHGVTHILAATLFLLAMPGLLTAYGSALRPWGRAAFVAAFLLYSGYLGVSYMMTLATPQIPAEVLDAAPSGAMAAAFLLHPLSAIALCVFGLALFRARATPRWASATFAIGSILVPITEVLAGLVLFPVTGAIVMGVGVIGLGLGLREHRDVAAVPNKPPVVPARPFPTSRT